jgi:hypothetical protein
VRDRRAGLRAAGLDAGAHPGWGSPPGGEREPKRLRLRIFAVAGRLVSSGRRLRLRLANAGPRPARSPPQPTICKPSHPADRPEQASDQKGETTRACGTPPTRRDRRAVRHGQTLKTAKKSGSSGHHLTDAKGRG